MRPSGSARSRPAEAAGQPFGLLALYAFTALSLAGFATFGRHPALLVHLPGAAGFYAVAFRFFAVAQVWLAAAVLAAFLVRHVGTRWVPALVALYSVSLLSELLGTGYGIPFGEYRYSALLGPMWLGRVPVVIPLSWFYMALPAYALALHALPGRARRAGRIGLASLVLLAWDLGLDPAMSHATRYWVWGEEGPYYGMPLLNLFGWYATGVALMAALAALRAEEWIRRLPLRWLAAFYGANLLLPLGMSAAAGLWGAVALTLGVLGGVAALARRLAARAEPVGDHRAAPMGARPA
jgi:putative membrane protein